MKYPMTNPFERPAGSIERREGRKFTAHEIFERNRQAYLEVVKQSTMGTFRSPSGGILPNIDLVIEAQGLCTLTEHQFGHGATRVGNGEAALTALYGALEKNTPFTGDFGPIEGTKEAERNKYPRAWESGKFIITRNDMNFYSTDGSLNTEGIEVILNGTLSPFGADLAVTFPEICFKDYLGKKF